MGRYVILPGDPKRCKRSRSFSTALLCGGQGPQTIGRGRLVSVTSTELAVLGFHCHGGVPGEASVGIMDLKSGGDIVIATGAVRMEGTSRSTRPLNFGSGESDVTNALVAARESSHRCSAVTPFYGQHDPERMPVSYELKQVGGMEAPLQGSDGIGGSVYCSCPLWRGCGSFPGGGKPEREKLETENPIKHDTERLSGWRWRLSAV